MSKVKGLRVMLGKTQQDLANVFNITPQSYSRKERGITPFTDKEKVIFKEMVSSIAPNESIDSIFFTEIKTK